MPTTPAALMLALLCGVRTCTARDERAIRLWSAGFLFASFIAYIVRPENLVPLGLCGLLLLYWHPRRKFFFFGMLLFVLVLTALHSWKWWLFGDLFPTGYYRKMATTGPWPGTDYVRAAFEVYRNGLLIVGGGLALIMMSRQLGPVPDARGPVRALPLLVVAALGSVAVVFKVTPIVRQGGHVPRPGARSFRC